MSEHLIRIEIEADSVERAQQLVQSQLSERSFLLSEKVVTHGGQHIARASAETAAAALAQARSRVPQGAEILDEREVRTPTRREVVVDAPDEAAAADLIKQLLRPTETSDRPRLQSVGRGGWFRIGRKPNRYTAEVVQLAIVEVAYKRRARIVAKIGRDTRAVEATKLLDDAERRDQPLDVICEHCGRSCKALPRPLTNRASLVMTPELAIVASRYCEKCNIVVCGACVGATLQSVAPGFGGSACPRCHDTTDFAATCHLRMTDTILAPR